MELKDFISETLKQIIDGVSDVQSFAKGKGAAINPELYPIQLLQVALGN